MTSGSAFSLNEADTERKDRKHMKKLLLIGGGAVFLIAAIAFGAFFAGPLLASANSSSSASSTSSPATNPYCEQYLQDLANRLHVSVTTLEQDKQSARDDVLNQMVKDGKLTQSQATALKQKLQSHLACTGNGNAWLAHFVARQFLSKYHSQIENSIAAGLHMTSTELTAQLQAGQSLSQIAAAHNVTSSQLRTIVSDAIQSALNTAVTKGDLTQSQATSFSQYLQSHPDFLDYILNAHRKGEK
jgi:polyhydroxyalkanoate synthesis regulator phasin